MALRSLIRLAAVAALALPQASGVSAADRPPAAGLLPFIRALEAPGGYDDYERRIPLPPPRPLTSMTVGEVLAWQDAVRRAGAPSTAAGGYQIIRATLKRLADAGKVSPGERFDAAVQDRLARLLIAECGTPGPPERHPAYGNCLAGIWASLPLTDGPDRGRSAYHGLAGNRALAAPGTVLALLAGEPAAAPPPSGERDRPLKTDGAALAFGAVRISRTEVAAAMRDARRDGTLTRSARRWSFDPYAVD